MTRPRVALPTGTLMGEPVSSTAMPRTSPSVACIATDRTVLLPMCEATSQVMWIFRALVVDLERGVDRRAFVSNVTSTTGPMTCEILPMFAMRYPFSASAPPTMSRSSS